MTTRPPGDHGPQGHADDERDLDHHTVDGHDLPRADGDADAVTDEYASAGSEADRKADVDVGRDTDSDLDSAGASDTATDALTRALAAARPPTAAEDTWSDSADAEHLLARIRAAAQDGDHRRDARIRLPRPVARPARRGALVGLGAAAAVVAIGVALVAPGGSQRPSGPRAGGSAAGAPIAGAPSVPVGPRPRTMALVGYDTCAGALAGLRAHAAARVTADGLPLRNGSIAYATAADGTVSMPSAPAASAPAGTVDHSGTNDQEAGVDEPDLVKTDGSRIVTVTGGALRIVDVATRAVTGRYDLTTYAGSDRAQLIVSGNRAMVLLPATYPSGPIVATDAAGLAGTPGATSTYLTFDLSGKAPRLLSVLHPDGDLLGARLVGSVARLVVRSSPNLALTDPPAKATAAQRIAAYRAQIARAPLSDWLPTYSVTVGATTTDHAVDCAQLSHPADYTGLSMATVYTVDLAGPATADIAPVSLAADSDAVYATPSSLYLAADTHPGSAKATTALHRFALAGDAPPTYVGSGTVPGHVADSYSLSEYDSTLRVVSSTETSDGSPAASAIYTLDAATLTVRGRLTGLGTGEALYAVRFLGPLAYVVTFEQVDPLHVVDLHDPAHPRLVGQLVTPGYSSYLHDVGGGHLLGVGESVAASGSGNVAPTGLQLSLFDVSGGTPSRLSGVQRAHASGGGHVDPHAFLYWPASRLAFVPFADDDGTQEGAVLVVRVGASSLTVAGTITGPTGGSGQSYDPGIARTFIVGDAVWTLSGTGLTVTDLSSLKREASVRFD